MIEGNKLPEVMTVRKLFEPIRIAGVEIKNRIAMLPLGVAYANEDGTVSDRLIDFYVERAKGGAGLIFIVCGYNDFGCYLPLHPALEDDRFIPGLRRLTDALHEHEVKVFAQLMHMGASTFAMPDGRPPVSASAIRSTLTGVMPHELTTAETRTTIEHFVEGAWRAREGGFDGVELVATGGYLINQFLSPLTNTREDEYGGDSQKRLRFPTELIHQIRQALGPGFPISCRTCGDEFMNGGNRQEEMKAIAQAFVKAGADLINVTAGWHQAFIPLITMDVPRGTYVYLAQGIKEAVTVPVIASNRINDPVLAESILLDHQADIIGMGRALLADPELPRKAAEGRYAEICPCIACNQRCLDAAFTMQEISCLINPAAGREREFKLEPAQKPRRVAVVGGGPAGMEAASTLARRGHRVTLFEKEDRLGGQLNLAAVPPGRGELACAIDYLSGELERSGVEVRLGQEASTQLIQDLRPDAVVLATGATPFWPGIPGIEGDNVVGAWDVLKGEAEAGDRVVVIGGGAVGLETALLLAKGGASSPESAVFLAAGGAVDARTAIDMTRGRRQVTVLEMLDRVGSDMGITTRSSVRFGLRLHNVKVITRAPARRITGTGVLYEQNGAEHLAEADTVVIATGSRPVDGLGEALQGIVPEICKVGDCLSPRTASEAIEEAARVGRRL